VDTEQCVPAQRFHVPILEVEGLVRGCGRGVVGGRLVVRGICDRDVDGRLVIGSICDREVGESGDADRWRLCDRRCGNHDIWPWGENQLEWGRLKDMRFGIFVGKSQGCDNGSCGGVFLVRARSLRFTSGEHG
jgi:hypothetical protein